ncbi:hypothetical protein FJ693_05720 [Georgenia yuyongxinii]|uniref:J domain-containing protein n=1 Tax=Georgenia yuyongxinii TaxID=2589797 RepID=A0A552WUM4_9MICO|nr:DnaJ domain-containing protein [Georgenia yuyongxinii]TRW46447.1 hypothetical protein FJ693_05720 [Georgenia yuyongxinii]
MRPIPVSDHYEVVGVGRDVTSEKLRRAYRRAARRAHPDAGGTDAAFAAVGEAFETLSDPVRRAPYNLNLDTPTASGAPVSEEPVEAPQVWGESDFLTDDDSDAGGPVGEASQPSPRPAPAPRPVSPELPRGPVATRSQRRAWWTATIVLAAIGAVLVDHAGIGGGTVPHGEMSLAGTAVGVALVGSFLVLWRIFTPWLSRASLWTLLIGAGLLTLIAWATTTMRTSGMGQQRRGSLQPCRGWGSAPGLHSDEAASEQAGEWRDGERADDLQVDGDGGAACVDAGVCEVYDVDRVRGEGAEVGGRSGRRGRRGHR